MAQVLKRLPTMRETRFDPWIGKIPWRRKWQPTPVLLPGKSHEWRSVVGYSPWNHKEPDMTERLYFLRTKNCNQLSRISYSLLPGLEKYCVNLDSLKYLKMVILSLPHLIFSKITVLVPYITVFRIPGRLFIYLPELFTCDPWMKLGCNRECSFTQNQRSDWKRVPIKVPGHG